MNQLDKHILKSHFVKVYLADDQGQSLTHFEGVIFSYTKEFVFMCDFSDFNHDGFIVLRKKDIAEVRRTDNEKFFDTIIREENLLRNVRVLKREAPFRLGSMEKMFTQLKNLEIPVIVECLYGEEESFQLGPVKKCNSEKVVIRYLSSFGVFDKEPMKIAYDDITFFRFGSPYANLFLKYASNDTVLEEMDVDIEAVTKVKKSKKEVVDMEEEIEIAVEEIEDDPIIKKKVKKKKDASEATEIEEKKKSKKNKKSKKDKKSKDKKSKKDKKPKKEDKDSIKNKKSKKDKSKKSKDKKKDKKKSKKSKKDKKSKKGKKKK